MKKFVLAGMLASSVVCVPLALADASGTTDHHFVKDSMITTKVKAAVFEESSLKSTEIKVETSKGIVQLSGVVSGDPYITPIFSRI